MADLSTIKKAVADLLNGQVAPYLPFLGISQRDILYGQGTYRMLSSWALDQLKAQGLSPYGAADWETVYGTTSQGRPPAPNNYHSPYGKFDALQNSLLTYVVHDLQPYAEQADQASKGTASYQRIVDRRWEALPGLRARWGTKEAYAKNYIAHQQDLQGDTAANRARWSATLNGTNLNRGFKKDLTGNYIVWGAGEPAHTIKASQFAAWNQADDRRTQIIREETGMGKHPADVSKVIARVQAEVPEFAALGQGSPGAPPPASTTGSAQGAMSEAQALALRARLVANPALLQTYLKNPLLSDKLAELSLYASTKGPLPLPGGKKLTFDFSGQDAPYPGQIPQAAGSKSIPAPKQGIFTNISTPSAPAKPKASISDIESWLKGSLTDSEILKKL